MAYTYNNLNQQKAGNGGYDKMFHQNTNTQNPNFKKKVQGNQQILNYRLFSGQYEQQQSSPFEKFDTFNENAKKNREQFQDYRREDPRQTVESFNKAIDGMHMPFDIQRPQATRDQVKDHYEEEHKSLYSHKKSNDYFNEHQFMHGKYSNPSASRFDFYGMQNDDKKGFEDLF